MTTSETLKKVKAINERLAVYGNNQLTFQLFIDNM